MRTIAHISDVHFGKNTPELVGALLEDLAAQRPDVVVVSGDLTQRARRSQYEQAREFLKQLPARHLVVPGNHDVPLWDILSRFHSPLGKFKRYITDDLMPVYRDDELLIVGLQSARSFSLTFDGFWKDGWLTDDQLARARAVLCEAGESVTKVVVTHHPFIPPIGHRNEIILGAERALRVFEECGVELLLGGHLHRSYRGFAGRILSVQAGTACSTRYRAGEGNAYNVMRVEAKQIELEVRALRDGKFQAS